MKANKRTSEQKADTNCLNKSYLIPRPINGGGSQSLEEESCNATRSYLQ